MNNPSQQQQANPVQERPCEKRVIYHCELPSSLKQPQEVQAHSGEGLEGLLSIMRSMNV